MICLLSLAMTIPFVEAQNEKPPTSPKTGLRRISPTLAYDLQQKRVVVDSTVVLREGPLELLLCPRRTKEHESILAAEIRPRDLQLALLLIGAVPGRPAEFDPFKPPIGQKIRITLEFEHEGKTHRIDARQWIRDTTTQKALDADFVFAGSRFHKVPGVDKAIWLGDDGDLVCVANFPGSILDVSVRSSKENAERLFEAWTERIPPKDTKVRVLFEPIPETPATPSGKTPPGDRKSADKHKD